MISQLPYMLLVSFKSLLFSWFVGPLSIFRKPVDGNSLTQKLEPTWESGDSWV